LPFNSCDIKLGILEISNAEIVLNTVRVYVENGEMWGRAITIRQHLFG
jgi:hypothetical protein